MAAGSIGGMFDPLKKKLQPVTRQLQRGRSGIRNLMGADKVYSDPAKIASAKRNPFLTVTEHSTSVPQGLSDQILRQYDPTGTGNPLGAMAPVSKAATFDTASTELDSAFLSSIAGTFASPKDKAPITPRSFGESKNFEMAFDMPKRKKRRSLYDIGGTA